MWRNIFSLKLFYLFSMFTTAYCFQWSSFLVQYFTTNDGHNHRLFYPRDSQILSITSCHALEKIVSNLTFSFQHVLNPWHYSYISKASRGTVELKKKHKTVTNYRLECYDKIVLVTTAATTDFMRYKCYYTVNYSL